MVSSTPRSHFTPGKDPVLILQEAGWATGSVWTGRKSRPHRYSIPDRPYRSQSLYRLSYPVHYIYIYIYIYRVSQEECARLRENVPYVKLYRYNPKHLCPKLNGYGVNGQRKVWASLVSTYCTPTVTSYLSNAPARQLDIVMQ